MIYTNIAIDGVRYISKNLDVIKTDGQTWKESNKMYALFDENGHLIFKCRKNSTITFNIKKL